MRVRGKEKNQNRECDAYGRINKTGGKRCGAREGSVDVEM